MPELCAGLSIQLQIFEVLEVFYIDQIFGEEVELLDVADLQQEPCRVTIKSAKQFAPPARLQAPAQIKVQPPPVEPATAHSLATDVNADLAGSVYNLLVSSPLFEGKRACKVTAADIGQMIRQLELQLGLQCALKLRISWYQDPGFDESVELLTIDQLPLRAKIEVRPAKISDAVYEKLRDVYLEIDMDGTDSINFVKLQQLVDNLALQKFDERDVRQLLRDMDADKNGSIGFAEFLLWWTSERSPASQRVKNALSSLMQNGRAIRREYALMVSSVKGTLFAGVRNITVVAGDKEQLGAKLAVKLGINDMLKIHYFDASFGTRLLLTDLDDLPAKARIEVEEIWRQDGSQSPPHPQHVSRPQHQQQHHGADQLPPPPKPAEAPVVSAIPGISDKLLLKTVLTMQSAYRGLQARRKFNAKIRMAKAVRSLANLAVSRAFARWFEMVEEKKHFRQVVRSVLKRMRDNFTLKIFLNWVQWTMEEQTRKRELAAMLYLKTPRTFLFRSKFAIEWWNRLTMPDATNTVETILKSPEFRNSPFWPSLTSELAMAAKAICNDSDWERKLSNSASIRSFCVQVLQETNTTVAHLVYVLFSQSPDSKNRAWQVLHALLAVNPRIGMQDRVLATLQLHIDRNLQRPFDAEVWASYVRSLHGVSKCIVDRICRISSLLCGADKEPNLRDAYETKSREFSKMLNATVEEGIDHLARKIDMAIGDEDDDESGRRQIGPRQRLEDAAAVLANPKLTGLNFHFDGLQCLWGSLHTATQQEETLRYSVTQIVAALRGHKVDDTIEVSAGIRWIIRLGLAFSASVLRMVWLVSGSGKIRVGDLDACLILLAEGTINEKLTAILQLHGVSTGRTWSVDALRKSLSAFIPLGVDSIMFQLRSVAHMLQVEATLVDIWARILVERMEQYVEFVASSADKHIVTHENKSALSVALWVFHQAGVNVWLAVSDCTLESFVAILF